MTLRVLLWGMGREVRFLGKKRVLWTIRNGFDTVSTLVHSNSWNKDAVPS